jgi:Uma2 family endonuclease
MATSINPAALEDLEDMLYPSSDGKPLGETDYHVIAVTRLFETLRSFFRTAPTVYVASNLFLYYEEGNPQARKAPDVMVVKGVAKGYRRTFKTWVEKALPCTVFEISSKKTRKEDLAEKQPLYASLGIPEYFLFDPEGRYLKPPLQGFRLKRKHYVPITLRKDGSLSSRELDMRLQREGITLRLIDARTGEPILSPDEQVDEERRRADQESHRANQESHRAAALEAQLSRLREELAQAKRRKR